MSDLGTRLQLHQNKAKEAVANEKAKVLHSQEVLDTKVDCTKAVLEAKYNYRAARQEGQNNQGQLAPGVGDWP